MLNSYEAIYDNGQLKWLNDQPDVTHSRVIVTIVEDIETTQPQTHPKRRFPPASIAGKGETLGDLVSPIVDEDDWECLK